MGIGDFSEINITNVMIPIAQIMTNNVTAWITSILIVLCSIVVYFGGFRRRVSRIRKSLEEAVSKLRSYPNGESFGTDIEAFGDWIQRNPVFGDQWREFCKTLMKPNGNTTRIRNIHESAFYFHEQSCFAERLNLPFYRSFPNYLTGFGILGTFLGLVFGIYLASRGLVSNDVQIVNKALSQLLGGASLAFLTSVAGLSSSIPFSWCVHHSLHKVQSLIAQLNTLLDSHMDLVTIEKLSEEGLREAKSQTDQLKRFNTDLAVSIAQALDERIAGRMIPSLDRLIEAVEQMRTDRVDFGEGALQQIVDRFQEAMQGAAGGQMNGLVGTLGKLDSLLQNTFGTIEQSQKHMTDSVQTIADNVSQSLVRGGSDMQEKMAQAIQELTNELRQASRESAENMRQSSTEASESMGITIRSLAATMQETTDTMKAIQVESQESVKSAAEAFRKTMNEGGNELIDKTKTASDELGNTAMEISKK